MLSIIVAVSKNGVIGCNNKLIWNIKDDLLRFKKITTNHTIIVGRKTFNALPFVLPNRHHIIITNNTDFSFDHPNVSIEHNLDSIISKYQYSDEEIFIIGGGNIYKQLLPFTSKIYLTTVLHEFTGDTTFSFNSHDFIKTFESEILTDPYTNFNYQYSNFSKV